MPQRGKAGSMDFPSPGSKMRPAHGHIHTGQSEKLEVQTSCDPEESRLDLPVQLKTVWMTFWRQHRAGQWSKHPPSHPQDQAELAPDSTAFAETTSRRDTRSH